MEGEKPCCPAAAARMTKQFTLADGLQVGIVNLENILREVADLKLTDVDAIKEELLQRVKVRTYVAPGAETDYSNALLREYEKLLRR
ncbi:MAG: hypothetical protein R6V59_03100 [Dehalococcoidia bacterium]